jgi:hypothetical protein
MNNPPIDDIDDKSRYLKETSHYESNRFHKIDQVTTTMVVQRLLAVLFAVLSSSTSAEVFPVGSSIRSWSDSVTKSMPGWSARKRLYVPVFLGDRTNVQASVKTKRRHANTGFYYGINESVLRSRSPSGTKKESLNSMMNDALFELKGMRQEMEALRKEMQAMKRRFSNGDGDYQELEDSGDTVASRRKKQREFDKIGLEVEQWAEHILFKQGEEEDGWKEVPCNKLVRNKYNPQGNTKCFMKWMTDSRGDWADPMDEKEYPCIKVFATIDAPIDEVCAYLAEEKRVPEYNDLVIQHRDLEEITPHSKVVWGIVSSLRCDLGFYRRAVPIGSQAAYCCFGHSAHKSFSLIREILLLFATIDGYATAHKS